MRNQNTPIAVEGYPFVLGAAFVTLVLALLSWKIPALLALGITSFIAYFFRNPQRIPPEGENLILAPADGVVIYLGNAPRESSWRGDAEDQHLHVGLQMCISIVFHSRVEFWIPSILGGNSSMYVTRRQPLKTSRAA